jgi:transglutaminase-like putative cysteine protease
VNLNRAYQWCALLLAVLGIVSFAAAAEQTSAGAPLILVWALPALCTGWYLSAARSFVLPRAAVNALLAGALAYAALQAMTGLDVNRVAELVIILLIIKVADRRQPRDDAQILCLSVFLAIAAMLTGNSLLVGVLLLLLLPLLIASVMLYQLQAGWLRSHPSPAALGGGGGQVFEAGGGPLLNTPTPTSTRWASFPAPGLGRITRRLVGVSSIGILAVALGVFIILPRGVGQDFMGAFGRIAPRESVVGFTERVSLGDRSLISENPEVAFTVEFRQGGVNLGSADNVFYLRGAVLDSYHKDNGRVLWTGAPKDRTPLLPTGSGDPIPITAHRAGTSEESLVSQTFHVEATTRNATRLFSLWRPIALETTRPGKVEINRIDGIVDLRSAPGPLTYTVRSVLSESIVESALQRTPVSFDSVPIHDLAARILNETGLDPDPAARPTSDDARAARMIQNHLRTGYTYTLVETGAPAGADPIEHFLFNVRAGHCEYFASAMVALCRSVGINARMVTGYVAAEYNEAAGHYIVRQSNAHAWVEAEAAPGGWLRFDPTPPGDLARLHRPAPGLFSRLRHVLDAAESAWNTSVVSFDESRRMRLLAPAATPGQALASRLEGFSERVRAGGGPLMLSALLRAVLVFAGVAALLFTLSFAWRLLPRRPGARPRRERPTPPRYYRALLRALRRRGHAKPLWRPPLDHAASLDPALAAPAAAIATLYYRSRFGASPLSPADMAHVRTLLRQLGARPVR